MEPVPQLLPITAEHLFDPAAAIPQAVFLSGQGVLRVKELNLRMEVGGRAEVERSCWSQEAVTAGLKSMQQLGLKI